MKLNHYKQNYQIIVEYDGSKFVGWQLQKNGKSIQDTIEKALKKDLGESADDSNVRYFAGDLREKLTLANLLSATVDAFDRVDVLVNASRQMATTDPLDMDDETVDKLLQQNLMTSLRLSQMVAKRMIKQQLSPFLTLMKQR